MSEFGLGRLLRHDERSKDFPARAAAVSSRDWTHHGGVLNQGNLGSCTGNAMVNCLNFDPNFTKRRLEASAVKCYSLATKLDNFAGQYPPDDTGSSGLGAAQAAKQLGWITGYTHAFGLDHLIGALQIRPVMVGTNWYEDMFNPDSNGQVSASGAIAGGHEWCVCGVDVDKRVVKALNSWGSSWGKKGYFYVDFTTMERLLNEDGDVTVPIGK